MGIFCPSRSPDTVWVCKGRSRPAPASSALLLPAKVAVTPLWNHDRGFHHGGIVQSVMSGMGGMVAASVMTSAQGMVDAVKTSAFSSIPSG